MSTVEETQEQAMGPCPNCKGGNVTVPGVKSVLHQVKCSGCGMRGPIAVTEADAIAAWNALSNAAALARAADVLGAWLQESTSHGLDMVRSRDGLNYVASTVDYVGGGYYHKRAHGATPAAALIALAGEVGE